MPNNNAFQFPTEPPVEVELAFPAVPFSAGLTPMPESDSDSEPAAPAAASSAAPAVRSRSPRR